MLNLDAIMPLFGGMKRPPIGNQIDGHLLDKDCDSDRLALEGDKLVGKIESTSKAKGY